MIRILYAEELNVTTILTKLHTTRLRPTIYSCTKLPNFKLIILNFIYKLKKMLKSFNHHTI